jgi:hypothetical protein
MTVEEGRKVDAEIAKLIAETAKLNAETIKLATENRWYPAVVGAGAMAGAIAAAVGFVRLFA